jgi:hypothetical protein
MFVQCTRVDTCFELAWLVSKVLAFVDSNDCETEMWLYNVYKTSLEHCSSASSSWRAECDVAFSLHSLSDLWTRAVFRAFLVGFGNIFSRFNAHGFHNGVKQG